MARFGLLCTLLLFGTAYGGTLLGGERCTWGPAYWCQGVDTAKECGTLDHCAQHVWSKQEVKNDAVCVTCQEVVAMARLGLSLNQTEEAIKEEMKKACDLMHGEALHAECKTLLETFFPEFIKLLKSDLEAKALCQALHLCKQGVALQNTKGQHHNVTKEPRE